MADLVADLWSTKIAIFPLNAWRTTAGTMAFIFDIQVFQVTFHASSVSAGASLPSWFSLLAYRTELRPQ
jgi:hypothetical protein